MLTPDNSRKERAILGSFSFYSFSPFYLLAPVSLRMPLVISFLEAAILEEKLCNLTFSS